MKDEEQYPRERDLDGVYFRVKRDGEWKNLCFSDLNKKERDTVTNGRPAEWIKELAYIMADVIRELGDYFDITNCTPDEVDEDG